MVINKSNVSFSQYMDKFISLAKEDHHFTLGHHFHESGIWELFNKGMDIHEAIETYIENLGNEK